MSEGGGFLAPPEGAAMEVDLRQASAAVLPPAAGPADVQAAEQAVEQSQQQKAMLAAIEQQQRQLQALQTAGSAAGP